MYSSGYILNTLALSMFTCYRMQLETLKLPLPAFVTEKQGSQLWSSRRPRAYKYHMQANISPQVKSRSGLSPNLRVLMNL